MEQALLMIPCALIIMNSIKLLPLLLASCAPLLSGADLADVHKVYVLPMAHGLEQFLANTLTNEHVFVIVTDPKLADAFVTDRIGPALQERMDIMLASPPPEKPAPKPGDKEAAKESGSMLLTDTVNKLEKPVSNSTVGGNKGTIFLVGAKSRQVAWSMYELPKDATSRELDRIASVIVSRLKKDMGLVKK